MANVSKRFNDCGITLESIKKGKVQSCHLAANHQIRIMNLAVGTEQETDGRWIAEIAQIPGALSYGNTRQEAISRVEALSLRVLADHLEHGEAPQELAEVFSVAA